MSSPHQAWDPRRPQLLDIYSFQCTTEEGDEPIAEARFDDQQHYEVTCFARRHLIPHDRGSPCHCPDTLFWSLPSPPYRLAPHFDVVGTSKRPVTVQKKLSVPAVSVTDKVDQHDGKGPSDGAQ